MIRELLNKLKWDTNLNLIFDDIKIFYDSRGEINGLGCLKGDEIHEIGKYFLETIKGSIPYHRIKRIEHKGKILFLNKETEDQ
jgi:uncharacterized protein (UPF0248 family)